MAPIALIAAGLVMLLICGEIDLSVGRVYASRACDLLLRLVRGAARPPDLGRRDRRPSALGVASSGSSNGVITTFLRVPSFITTLGMALPPERHHPALLGRRSRSCTPGGETFLKIFGSQPVEYVAYFNSTFWWALGNRLVMQFVLTWTRWGLHTVATGGNLRRRARGGVNVRMIKIGNFVLCQLPRPASRGSSTRPGSTTIQAAPGRLPDLMFSPSPAR